jgi:hypothetical protein
VIAQENAVDLPIDRVRGPVLSVERRRRGRHLACFEKRGKYSLYTGLFGSILQKLKCRATRANVLPHS